MEELLKVDIKAWQLIWAIIAFFIGIIFNRKTTSYKVKAELKAKTRLQWIEDVRTITADIVTDYHEMIFIIKRNYEEYEKKTTKVFDDKTIKQFHDFQVSKYNREVSETYIRFKKNITLFKLYFAPYTKDKKIATRIKSYKFIRFFTKKGIIYTHSEDNKKMHKFVDKVYKDIMKMEDEFTINRNLFDPNKLKGIKIFREKVSKYLKKEWDRAKENE